MCITCSSSVYTLRCNKLKMLLKPFHLLNLFISCLRMKLLALHFLKVFLIVIKSKGKSKTNKILAGTIPEALTLKG